MNSVTQYLASIGRKGGKAKTSAKSAAAIANGKLGGRPKSKKRVARRHNIVLGRLLAALQGGTA